MDPMGIPAVQRRIAEIDLKEARGQTLKMLSFGSSEEVADYLKSLEVAESASS